jgi:hypothetical protein
LLVTVGSVKHASKGRVEKDYQTPYGVATVARHVRQSTHRLSDNRPPP